MRALQTASSMDVRKRVRAKEIVGVRMTNGTEDAGRKMTKQIYTYITDKRESARK